MRGSLNYKRKSLEAIFDPYTMGSYFDDILKNIFCYVEGSLEKKGDRQILVVFTVGVVGIPGKPEALCTSYL